MSKNSKTSHCIPQVKTQYSVVDTEYSLVMKCNVFPLQIKSDFRQNRTNNISDRKAIWLKHIQLQPTGTK